MSITESLGELYDRKKFSDIFFSFPNEPDFERIPAHKLMLSIRSPVFEAMFYGDLAETAPEVKIEDIAGSLFTKVLKYIYTDKIDDINGDNVTKILYMSTKYQIKQLTSVCEKYLNEAVDIDNVCTILTQARFFQLTPLIDKCMSLIEKEASQVIQTEDFLAVPKDTLAAILHSDNLCVKEVCLFKAVTSWSRNACFTRGIEETQTNKREMLGECLFSLRIPVMDVQDFRTVVVEEEILTEQEELQLFRYVTGNRQKSSDTVTNIAGFSTKTRRPTFVIFDLGIINNRRRSDFELTFYQESRWERISVYSETEMVVTRMQVNDALENFHKNFYDMRCPGSGNVHRGNSNVFTFVTMPLIEKHDIESKAIVSKDPSRVEVKVNDDWSISETVLCKPKCWVTFTVELSNKCRKCEQQFYPNLTSIGTMNEQYTLTADDRTIFVKCDGFHILKSFEVEFL